MAASPLCSILLLLAVGTLPGIGGLHCYSCHGSTEGSACQTDMGGLLGGRGSGSPAFTKNCDIEDPSLNLCSVEIVEAQGTVRSIIRDCNDGKTFSSNSGALENIVASNQSTCATLGDKVICVWLCRGSYCNGPQTLSAAAMPTTSYLPWILAFMDITLHLRL